MVSPERKIGDVPRTEPLRVHTDARADLPIGTTAAFERRLQPWRGSEVGELPRRLASLDTPAHALDERRDPRRQRLWYPGNQHLHGDRGDGGQERRAFGQPGVRPRASPRSPVPACRDKLLTPLVHALPFSNVNVEGLAHEVRYVIKVFGLPDRQDQRADGPEIVEVLERHHILVGYAHLFARERRVEHSLRLEDAGAVDLLRIDPVEVKAARSGRSTHRRAALGPRVAARRSSQD